MKAPHPVGARALRWLFCLMMLLPLLTPEAGSAPMPTNWPDFRGPSGDGRAAAGQPPRTWSEQRNLRWKISLPGRSWSSPVVWNRQIWLTTASEDGRQMSALCVDQDSGKVVMDRVVFTNREPEPLGLGKEGNTYASPSPVIEEGRVFLHFGTYGTACLDTRSFRTLWQRRDILCRHSVGPGSSPVLFRHLLILTMDGTDSQFLIALDKRTGRTAWKAPRSADWSLGDPADSTPRPEQQKAFSTPLITQWEGRPLLISSGAKASYGYDPLTGKELWKVGYRGFSNASRPIAGHGFALINTGYHRAELWAVRLGGSGDVTSTHVAWKAVRNVPLNPSPVLVGDRIYMLSGAGILTCLNARSGEEVWKDRLPGTYTASPVLANGLLYCFGENGQSSVIRPGDRLEIVGENRLEEGAMACPAFVGNEIVLRTRTHLYCLAE